MSVIDDIKSKRTWGVLHCGYLPGALSMPAVASSFSLSPDTSLYRQVGKGEAVQILTHVLHKDMAYGSEIMPVNFAREMSTLFLEAFDDASSKFFTNIDFPMREKLGKNCWAGPDWKPVTKATFDAGVIAISSAQCACLWIEDED